MALITFKKPIYGALASAVKFGLLLIGLPLAFIKFGMFGAITFLVVSEISRYVPLLIGQVRERFSFVLQDLATTLFMFGLIGLLEWLRWALGLGTSVGIYRFLCEGFVGMRRSDLTTGFRMPSTDEDKVRGLNIKFTFRLMD